MNKTVNIFGGGTVAHIANHLALAAPAYGSTARQLNRLCLEKFKGRARVHCHYTKMAGGDLETNEDVKKRVDSLVKNPNTMIIFFNCALVDYEPKYIRKYCPDTYVQDANIGKYSSRIDTSRFHEVEITARKTDKIISTIRKDRKDIFLVGFKTTCGATQQEMYLAGLKQLKTSHVNLCLVNDTKTRMNMIVTPEEATYCVTGNRDKCLRELVDMAYFRSHLKFTQSTVLDGKLVDWNTDNRVPESLRTVVNYCRNQGAYKAFNGATVGHFACKLSDTEFLTSIRRSNFNDLDTEGLVYVKSDGPDTVLAYGAKPSVGGQSQRIVFNDHEGYDCIVHFHCPNKYVTKDVLSFRSQKEVECGSHECGKNTSDGLKEYPEYGGLKCVMLENHGPNIVFKSSTDPQLVIDFIKNNFDLSEKTGGYQLV